MGENNNASIENSGIVTFADSSPDDATIISYYPRKSSNYPNPKNMSKAPIQYIYLVYNDSTVGSNFITAYWDYKRDWQPDTSKWNKDGSPKKDGAIYQKQFTVKGVKTKVNSWGQIKDIQIKWYYRAKNETVWRETPWESVYGESTKYWENPPIHYIPDFRPQVTKSPWAYTYASKEIFDTVKQGLQPGDSVQDIKFSIKVIPAEYETDKKGTKKLYWTGPDKTDKSETYTTDIINIDSSINDYYPNTPNLSLSIEGLQLTAKSQLTDDDVNTKYIIFYLFDKNTESQITSIKVQKAGLGGGNEVSAVFSIDYGKSYIVRAKAFNDSIYDRGYGVLESDYSEPKEITGADVAPPVIDNPSDPDYESYVPAISSSSYSYKDEENNNTYINLQWTMPKGYSSVIQYATSITDLDSFGGNVNTIENGKDITSKVIGPLTTGYNYYFRIAIKNDKGTGGWSSVWSVSLGEKPDIPNIGTKNNIFDYDIGETVGIWWTHQSTDGAKEKKATIYIKIPGNSRISDIANSIGGTVSGDTISVVVNKNSSDKTTVSEWSFTIDPKYFTKNSAIYISVKTTSTLDMTSDLSKTISISCWVKAYAYINMYRRKNWIWDPFNFKIDTIYSALGDFNIDDMVEDNAVRQFPFYITGTVDPVSSKIVDYTFTITAKTQYKTVNIIGEDVFVNPGDEIWSTLLSSKNARYDYDNNSVQLYMMPTDIRLQDGETYEAKFVASLNNGKTVESESYIFTVELDTISYVLDADIEYNKDDISTTIQPHCYDYSGNLVNYVFLSVYRESYYGEFVKIAENLNNAFNPTIKDPYPTLRNVKYRLVGIDILTGSVFYEDLPLFPIPETAIIIQWDAKWKFFDVEKEETIFFEGSLLKLPFNISTSESPEVDVDTVEYIGREYPVSYYGTHVKEVVTWQTDIVREDTETLYGVRRLAKYKGNVYVREPNGLGFLATVKVSFNIENLAVIIPVTLTVTRVEE